MQNLIPSTKLPFLVALLLGCFFFAESPTLQAQRALLDKRQSTTCLDREFVVMAHLVRDTFQTINSTPEEIEAALELANLWFEPICTKFVLRQVDTIDNFQYSIPENSNVLDQLWANHHENNRINLYIVSDVSFVSPEPTFATFEGILQNDRGGILINSLQLNDAPVWLVHGLGHYCGLLDTNEDFTSQLVNGDNCETTGDEICDTPADPYNPNDPEIGLSSYVNMECRFIFSGLDANSEFYLTQTGNAMSLYPAQCWCGLTYGQFERMAEVIGRSGLW
ncbi:hypothetical protein [Lewinella cohaerens]|uniref:hypothetical protein n=1 Tax=Lewinella cohaerens TaxID=70995 RepID=UPI00036C4C9E|nr:hypothetical protein [Lewinella cohaerens]